jgi:hypothetical protein
LKLPFFASEHYFSSTVQSARGDRFTQALFELPLILAVDSSRFAPCASIFGLKFASRLNSFRARRLGGAFGYL